MSHYAHSVKRRLSVEKNDVCIFYLSLHFPSKFNKVSKFTTVLIRDLHAASIGSNNIIGARMIFWTPSYIFFCLIKTPWCNEHCTCKFFSYFKGYSHLEYSQVRIW